MAAAPPALSDTRSVRPSFSARAAGRASALAANVATGILLLLIVALRASLFASVAARPQLPAALPGDAGQPKMPTETSGATAAVALPSTAAAPAAVTDLTADDASFAPAPVGGAGAPATLAEPRFRPGFTSWPAVASTDSGGSLCATVLRFLCGAETASSAVAACFRFGDNGRALEPVSATLLLGLVAGLRLRSDCCSLALLEVVAGIAGIPAARPVALCLSADE